jgi:hypothetical protein
MPVLLRSRRAVQHRLLALAGVALVILTLVLGVAGVRLARAADLFTELRSFPGVVLLPAASQEPFAQLEPWRVELNRPRPGSTAVVHGRYLVQYRDPLGGVGSAQIGGSLGREELDQTVATLAGRSFKRCAADTPYCAETVAGLDGAAPASEVFRGLSVGEGPAVVEHVVCCGGHYWSLTWYDPARDMTYGLVLVGPVADLYGDTISPENAGVAASLADVAGRLAPLE